MVHVEAGDVAAERPDGRATRWDSHRATRRLELVRAAARCVRERGPDVSMDELAAEIGTSKSILYRYFTDKAGLQRAVGRLVLDRMLHELTEAAAQVGGPRERIRAMVDTYLRMVDDAPHVYAFVTSPVGEGAAGEVRGFVDEVDTVVAQTLVPTVLGLDDDAEPAELTAEQAVRATLWAAGVVGTVRAVAERWLGARSGSVLVTGDLHPDQEASVAAVDRDEVAALLSSWLWDGAVGVARRARTDTQPRTVQGNRTEKDTP